MEFFFNHNSKNIYFTYYLHLSPALGGLALILFGFYFKSKDQIQQILQTCQTRKVTKILTFGSSALQNLCKKMGRCHQQVMSDAKNIDTLSGSGILIYLVHNIFHN